MLRLLLFALFIVIPVAEIAVFILIGGIIGVLPTLAIILLTAVIGSGLLRRQGTQVLRRIRAELDAGRIPGSELGHGAMILVAGVLLLTPGFVTDTLGFLLFVPSVRRAIWRFVKNNLRMLVVPPRPARGPDGGPVIDLDEAEFGTPNDDTPWRVARASGGGGGNRTSDGSGAGPAARP